MSDPRLLSLRLPTQAELLEIWEHGFALPPLARLELLVRLSSTAADTGCDVAQLPLGVIDRHLLDLRVAVFGDRFEALARCPRCDQPVECAFSAADVLQADMPGDARVPDTGELEAEGWRLRYRPPTMRDLEVAASGAPESRARQALIETCVLSAEAPDREGPATVLALPAAVISSLAEALEQTDPQACTQLELSCPACAEVWTCPFDVGAYFWSELHTWAQGTMREIHLLARAYGWTQSDILGLSPRRRRAYLELIAG